MARLNSMITFSGTFNQMTRVRSKAYPDHIRAARGTKSEVDVNAAFKKSTGNLLKANKVAKLIKDMIDIYRTDFPRGQLWQNLVSVFKHQAASMDFFTLEGLKDLDIHTDHRFSRFIAADLDVKQSDEVNKMQVTFKNCSIPIFRQKKFIDGYRMSIIAIFVNFDTMKADSICATFPVMPLNESYNGHQCDLYYPDGADQYMLCCKIEGMSKGEAPTGIASKGMIILEAGRLHQD